MIGSKKLVDVFRDTMDYVKNNIPAAESPRTQVVDEDFDIMPKAPGADTSIHVVDADSLTGASEGVLVLNFASGWTPGGGVVKGCSAQEENICQRSSLYPELVSDTARPFYEVNHQHPNISTDIMLLTKDVTVLKDADFAYIPKPFNVDILTVAAPRLTDGVPVPLDELNEVLKHRVYAIVKTCAKFGYKRIVLGAWGCGAYRNDPVLVSSLFREALQEYGGYFSEVVFAIPAGRNYNIFSDALSNL